MAFTYKLEHGDGTPADPPILRTAVSAWSPGDTIPLGRDRILRVTEGPARYRFWREPGACGRSRLADGAQIAAHRLEWQDVDVAGSRFRIRHGKTAAARRWVGVPDDLMDKIVASTPPDDRTAERRVFSGFTPDVAKNVMARACRAAGIVHRHPHDLRHRYASLQIARGVPVTEVAAALGHSRKSVTLDTYSHVLVD